MRQDKKKWEIGIGEENEQKLLTKLCLVVAQVRTYEVPSEIRTH